MCSKNEISPCVGCVRVRDPEACENKNCKHWKAWFLRRWAGIYGYARRYGLDKKRNEGIL